MSSDSAENQPSLARSTFPAPPAMYFLYTNDKLESSGKESKLWTPPPPVEESFVKFGAPQSTDYWVHDLGDTVPKLFQEDSDTEKDIFDRINFNLELRKLLRKSGDEYVHLLEDLRASVSDENINTRITGISDIFANMSHLLNLLRGHQARQTLIYLLQQQIKTRQAECQKLEEINAQSKLFLEQHGLDL